MNILSIDSATELLSIGLRTRTEILYEHTRHDGFSHVENLVPTIQSVLSQASLATGDIDLIVCAKGPGSFTGLRIGLSTAKGLSLASGCSLITIPTLDAYAYRFCTVPGVVLPVIDARKGRIYTAVYENGIRQSDYLDIPPSDVPDLIETRGAPITLTGTSSRLLGEIRNTLKGAEADPCPMTGRSEAFIALGKKLFEENGPDPDDAGPLYIRKSDAELGSTGG